MAKSKYAYVKDFEDNNSLLPHTWVVIRIDGHAFTRFSDVHGFQKPNDEPALQLMNECAKGVLQEMPDLVFAYGESDDYSFVLKKSSTLQTAQQFMVSLVVPLFSATYVLKWPSFFPEKPLQYAPSFDGRADLVISHKNSHIKHPLNSLDIRHPRFHNYLDGVNSPSFSWS